MVSSTTLPSTIAEQLWLKGHVCHRQAFPGDYLRLISAEVDSAVQRAMNESDKVCLMETSVTRYGAGWHFFENLWIRSPFLRRTYLSGPIARAAASILKNLYPSVRGRVALLRDQSYYKLPGSEATPWHQDGTFIPLDDVKSITLWIPFDSIGSDMSPMHYVDSSHLSCWLGPDSDNRASSLSNTFSNFVGVADMFRSIGCRISSYGEMEVGDILIHLPWTLHGAPVHRSTITRRAIVVVYFIYEDSVSRHPGLRLLDVNNTGQARAVRSINCRTLFNDCRDGSSLRSLQPSKTPFVRVPL